MIRRSRTSVQSRRHQAASAAAQVPHWRPQVTSIGQGLPVLSGPSAPQAGPPRRRRLGRPGAGHGCLALPCRPALRTRPRPGACACACPTALADPAPRASNRDWASSPAPQEPHCHSVADAQSRCHRPRAVPARGLSSLGRHRRGRRAKAAAPRPHARQPRPAGRVPPAGCRQGQGARVA
jgi:hypothetical protein